MIKVLLEKLKNTDIKKEILGIQLFIDKNLDEQIEGLYIHYIENQYYTGFKIESQLKE